MFFRTYTAIIIENVTIIYKGLHFSILSVFVFEIHTDFNSTLYSVMVCMHLMNSAKKNKKKKKTNKKTKQKNNNQQQQTNKKNKNNNNTS